MYSSVFMNNEGGLEMDLKLNYAELIKKLIVVIIAGLLNAIGMNLFLTPAKVYASGFAGLSQLLSQILGDFYLFTYQPGYYLACLTFQSLF